VREIFANAPVVASQSIDNWRVGRQRQHDIQRIVAEGTSIEPDTSSAADVAGS